MFNSTETFKQLLEINDLFRHVLKKRMDETWRNGIAENCG